LWFLAPEFILPVGTREAAFTNRVVEEIQVAIEFIYFHFVHSSVSFECIRKLEISCGCLLGLVVSITAWLFR